MRGDVLLWTSDGGPISRAICIATHGPFCHVSVDLGDGTDIGAHSGDGVQRHVVPDSRGITHFNTVKVLIDLDGKTGLVDTTPYLPAIECGITFVEGEVGNKYGWSNIFNNVLKILRIPYRISRIDRYDCSSLVTRYLEKVSMDLGDLGEEPDSVSPNDLAPALGVL